MHPSNTQPKSQVGNSPTIQPKLSIPFKLEAPEKELSAINWISSQETLSLAAIGARDYKHEQDSYYAWMDEVASQATLPLPVLKGLTDQRQVIASTASNAAIAGMGDLTLATLRYITNVVMTNIVSASIYGIYSTVYTTATIVGSIAALGLDTTILRFLPAYRAKDEHGLAGGLLRFVLWTTFISGLLFGGLFYLSSSAISLLVYHSNVYELPLKEITLVVPLLALQLVFANGLLALKAIRYKVLVDRLIQPTLCLVLIGVFHLLGLELEALILATICSYLASVITGKILLRKTSQRHVHKAVPQFEPKIWLPFSLPMSFYALIQTIMNSTDVLFLTVFATSIQVGIYTAADRTSTFVIMPIFGLSTVFSPMIAEYFARKEHKQLASLAKLVTKWSFSLSFPIFLCCCVFHEAILSIFSQEYSQAGIALIILSLGNLVYVGMGSSGSVLAMTGHARAILANTVVTIVINIGLALVLVPRFNIVGAAIAAALADTILGVAYCIEVYWLLKIITLRWDMVKPLAAGGVASIAGLLLQHIIHVGYGFRAIIGALGLIIPFLVVYVVALAFLRFSSEDKVVLDMIRAKLGVRSTHVS